MQRCQSFGRHHDFDEDYFLMQVGITLFKTVRNNYEFVIAPT